MAINPRGDLSGLLDTNRPDVREGIDLLRAREVIREGQRPELIQQQIFGNLQGVNQVRSSLEADLRRLQRENKAYGQDDQRNVQIANLATSLANIQTLLTQVISTGDGRGRSARGTFTPGSSQENINYARDISVRSHEVLTGLGASEQRRLDSIRREREREEARREREEGQRAKEREQDAHREKYMDLEFERGKVSEARLATRNLRVAEKLGILGQEDVNNLRSEWNEPLKELTREYFMRAEQARLSGDLEAARMYSGFAGTAGNTIAEQEFLDQSVFNRRMLGARNLVRMGKHEYDQDESISEVTRKALSDELTKLREEGTGLMAQAGRTTDVEEQDILIRRGQSALGQANQIEQLLTKSGEDQNNTLKKTMQQITQVVTALGVAQIAGRLFIQEPYQFRTRPALDVMGNQSELGGIMSQAYGELEQHRVGLNQMGFNMGLGLVGTGLALGGPMGAVIGAAGAGLGALGLGGGFDDLWFMNPLATDESTILGQSLAKSLMNPQRLVEEFSNSRAGLFQHGALGMPDFGFGAGGSTGNAVLNPIGDQLVPLGYNVEQIGSLLSQASLNLRGDVTGSATLAGRVASAYGVSEDSVLSGMATAQRYGAGDDGQASYLRAMYAAAGPDGEPTSYTTNVLVPALMQVVESMAIQNLARSSQELETEVFGLRQTIIGTTADSNLKELMATNPAILSQVMNTLTSAAQSQLQDPASTALHLALGSTYTDMAFGRGGVTDRGFGLAFRAIGQDIDLSGDDPLGRNKRFFTALSTITKIDNEPLLLELAKIYQEEGTLYGKDGNYSDRAASALAGQGDEISSRVNEIVESQIGQLAANMAEHTNEVLNMSRSLIEDMILMQEELTRLVKDQTIVTLARDAIQEIRKAVMDILGNTQTSSAPLPIPGTPLESTAMTTAGITQEQLDNARDSDGEVDWNEIYRETGYLPPVEETWPGWDVPQYNKGGFTGIGGTHKIAGVVHAGEYVISQQNVNDNRQVLDEIQSGKRVSDSSVRNSGTVTYVTMKITGMDPESIYQMAESATERYIVRNRLQY